MRAKLGAASRAAMQFGPTITRRDAGTSPLTAFGSGVGRFWGLMGLTAPTGTDARPSSATSAGVSTSSFRMARIQAANRRRLHTRDYTITEAEGYTCAVRRTRGEGKPDGA